jgi:hypothetical protein
MKSRKAASVKQSADSVNFQLKLDRFLMLIRSGLDNLAEAGRLLVQMVEDNPDTFEMILKQCPTLKEPNLWSLYYVGQGRPVSYLLSESPGVRRLRSLPPEVQVKIPSRIPVVEQTPGGSFKVVSKAIEELTLNEATRVLTFKGVETPATQQEALLAEQSRPIGKRLRYREDDKGVTFYERVHMTWAELEGLVARGKSRMLSAASIKAAIQKGQVRD